MSTIHPIRHPLPGEQVLALSPSSADEAARTWRRRPNLVPGRALTAPALEARQQWAAGIGVLRGQAFTAGVVRGLEVEPLPAADSESAPARLLVSPGQGLSVSGEDVGLPRAVEFLLDDLPVVREGRIGAPLGRWRGREPGLPRAGVLVLQPVVFERSAIDADDPCDRCPCGDGEVNLEDWRLVDAARLLWFAWPGDFGFDPLHTPGPLVRNQLAWAVFEAEARLGPDAALPWEDFGVPLALIGLDEDLRPSFVDRAAVVRRGGLDRDPRLARRADGSLMESWRLPGLWQARIEQLAGHLLDLMNEAAGDPAVAVNAAIEQWPPCGILPRWGVDLDARRADLFPAGFVIDAVPVPQEDLDPIIRETAGLAPIFESRTERVQVLIPVPQALYEPRLLLTETIDPLFSETLERFLLDRARALASRHTLETRDAVLSQALTGTPKQVRAIGADPAAPEPEALPAWPLPTRREGRRLGPQAGWIGRRFSAAPLPVGEAERPFLWLCLDPDQPVRTLALQWGLGDQEIIAIWGEESLPPDLPGTGRSMGALPPAGQWIRLEAPQDLLPAGSQLEALGIHVDAGTTPGAVALASTGVLQESGEEREWRAASTGLLADPEVNPEDRLLDSADMAAPFEDRHGVVVIATDADSAAAPRSQTLEELIGNPALAFLSQPERDQIRSRGVAAGITYLRDRADRLDDAIDAGFLRVQTDTYRLRQRVLNAKEASRLLVSPILAGIAKAETASVSQEQLSTYLKTLRQPSTQAATRTAAPSPEPGGRAEPSGGRSAPSSRSGAADQPRASVLATPRLALFNATEPSRRSTRITAITGTTVERNAVASAVRVEQPSSPALLADRLALKPQITEARSIGLAKALSGSFGYKPIDISQAAPVVGKPFIRTTRISQRLADPPAIEANDYALATRHSVVLTLSRLARDLAVEDGQSPDSEDCQFPGFVDTVTVPGFPGEDFLQSAPDGLLVRFAGSQQGVLLNYLLNRQVPEDNEASIFSEVTELGEQTIGLLRQVEGRVQLYRDAISACESAQQLLQDQLRPLRRRLAASEERLAEARHDVAVCRALIDEEEGRVATINERRRRVLAEAVPFVAYRRLRTADDRMDVPTRPLDPGLLDAPVPACLESHEDIPEQLEGMLSLVREAPAAWFGPSLQMLAQLDRMDRLLRAVGTAQRRSRSPRWLGVSSPVAKGAVEARFDQSRAMAAVQQRQIATLSLRRQASARLDTERLALENLLVVRERAQEVVSLGDLAEGEHGDAALAQEATTYLGTISRISACLHAGLSTVPAALRLTWAETLSAFDQAPSLRNLSALQGFAGLPYGTRRQLQALADWLFDQLATSQKDAAELINDLVRVCLLLASHAPVGRLIAGRLARPVRPRPGSLIPIRPIQGAVLRVGMQATLFRGQQVVARAVLQDVGREESQARVIAVEGENVELGAEVRVQFTAARVAASQRIRMF